MMSYSMPEMFEIDAQSIDLMCACTSDDTNPYRVQL